MIHDVLTSVLPHKKFTWADFGGINSHIPPRRYAPDPFAKISIPSPLITGLVHCIIVNPTECLFVGLCPHDKFLGTLLKLQYIRYLYNHENISPSVP